MRVYNFSAGPAALPEAVLKAAQAEFLDWQGLGVSVMEISHRDPRLESLFHHNTTILRELLQIPDSYQIFFLGTPARAHFAMVPMNLLHPHERAGYVVSGLWSSLAYQEAQKLRGAAVYDGVEQQLQPNTRYVYYTPNETVDGIRTLPPIVGDIPLVADMTSCLLGEPIDIASHGMIFAGAQKNIAPAGLSIVIMHESLLTRASDQVLPTLMDYRTFKGTLNYATPPVFNCYLAGKMFDWVRMQGGVEVLGALNRQKAALLYDYIDQSDFYVCDVPHSLRSIFNVCFYLKKPQLEARFVLLAERQGLFGLKGHRFAGGLRASLYNAMPLVGVEVLIDFMQEFSKT